MNEHYNPSPFKLSDSTVDIEVGKSKNIKIYYIPFEVITCCNQLKMCETGCLIHFYDEKVGEFLYKLEGIPKMPVPTETINWMCKTDVHFEKSIKIFHNNPVRDRAVHSTIALGYSLKNTDNPKSGFLLKNSSFHNTEKDAFALPKKPLNYSVRKFF